MTRSENEKQSYKLGPQQAKKKKKKARFEDLSVKHKWHVHGHSRGFHVSRYRSKYTIFDNS